LELILGDHTINIDEIKNIKLTNTEISLYLRQIETSLKKEIQKKTSNHMWKTKEINNIYKSIGIISGNSKTTRKDVKIGIINDFMNTGSLINIIKVFDESINEIYNDNEWNMVKNIFKRIENIHDDILNMKNTMKMISAVLDESIHGHKYAKKQIMKIICQWINGEQTGYCFGFEGSPGIGKTSLAKKGLANCLTDENGNTRPFSFIALGG